MCWAVVYERERERQNERQKNESKRDRELAYRKSNKEAEEI